MSRLPAIPFLLPGSARLRSRTAWYAALLAAAVSGWGVAAAAPGMVEVAQRGRAFQPGQVELARDAVIRFVNDDGQLLHHVYAKSDAFSFDIGEQPAGAAVDVRFPTAGNFTVLCGIHPKMRLQVVVR